MLNRVSWRGFGRAAMACVMAGLVLCASGFGPASAEDDDDELLDVKAFRGIMRGLGLQRGDEANIEYRERSPLVVPPSTNLPQPENPALAERNPAWPNDPDVSGRKEIAKRKRKAIDWDEEGRVLTPEQLNKGVPRGGPIPAPAAAKTAEESARPSSPTELGFHGFDNWRSLFGFEPKEEAVHFDREPQRSDLTKPPPGYLTPSSSQPYGYSRSQEKATSGPVDAAVGQIR
jgi:hypothetical protein